jgi:hypothetical protein
MEKKMSVFQIKPLILALFVMTQLGCMSEGQLHHLLDDPNTGTHLPSSTTSPDESHDARPTDSWALLSEQNGQDESTSDSDNPELQTDATKDDSEESKTDDTSTVDDFPERNSPTQTVDPGADPVDWIHNPTDERDDTTDERDDDFGEISDNFGEISDNFGDHKEDIETAVCRNTEAIELLECQQSEADRIRFESLHAMEADESALLRTISMGARVEEHLDSCVEVTGAAYQAIDDARKLSENIVIHSLADQLELQHAYGKAIGISTAARICLSVE